MRSQDKKEIAVFIVITYGGSFLIRLPFNVNHQYTPFFLNVIMFLPAVGAIASRKYREGNEIFKQFHQIYLIGISIGLITVIGYISGLIAEKTAVAVVNLIIAFMSIFSLIIMREEMKIIEGMKKVKSIFFSFIFIEVIISLLGTDNSISAYMQALISVIPRFLIAFGMSISLCVGEELGWRGFLQGKLQERFGLKRGVILLGIIWELWHIPLWFTQYELSFYEVCLRFPLTISFSIFLGYLYMKTKNVWVCAIFHLMTNMFSGRFEEHLTYHEMISGMSLSEIVQIVFMLSLFIFIFSNEYKDKKGWI